MLPVKVKMRRFNYTNLWVYRNLRSHLNVTWKVISNRIKVRKSKSQNNVIERSSFASTAHATPMVELSNSTGWDFESTIKFNASMGKEHCGWFVCGVCGTEAAFDIKQVDFTVSSLFLPRPASCSRQFTLNGSNFGQHFTAAEYNEKKWFHEVGLDRYLGTFIRESAKSPHIIEQPNT